MMRVHDTAAPTQLGLFLWLVFAISVPFWLLGAFSEAMLLPHLPLSALMAACPGLVALALVWRWDGEKGARALLARLWDWRRIPGLGWGAALVLCMPVLLALAWGLMWLAGAPLPDKVRIDFSALPVLLLLFAAGAVGEELGWSAFALDRMRRRWGTLSAALILGLVWTLWHVVPFLQTGRAADWIVWHCLVTLATRVVMIWFCVNTGRSVFGQVLFHTMSNVAYFMFPNGGSHYSAAVFAPVITAMAIPCALLLRRVAGDVRRDTLRDAPRRSKE